MTKILLSAVLYLSLIGSLCFAQENRGGTPENNQVIERSVGITLIIPDRSKVNRSISGNKDVSNNFSADSGKIIVRGE